MMSASAASAMRAEGASYAVIMRSFGPPLVACTLGAVILSRIFSPFSPPSRVGGNTASWSSQCLIGNPPQTCRRFPGEENDRRAGG